MVTKDDMKNDFFKFWNDNSLQIWQQVFKSKTVNGISFENIKTGEDICYVMDALSNAETVAYIPKVLYHYRYIKGSTCHSWNENNIGSLEIMLEHRKIFLSNLGESIDKTVYSIMVYGDYFWEIFQLSSSFCPLSFNEKMRELSKVAEMLEFKKYRRIYPLKLQHGIDKIYCILIKCHSEWIILMFRAVLLKLLKGE